MFCRKFLLTPMGVLAPVCACLTVLLVAPIDMSGNLSVHLFAKSPSNVSSKHSYVIAKFLEPWTTFENPPFVKNRKRERREEEKKLIVGSAHTFLRPTRIGK